jgi:hypothetical protein
MVPTARPTNGDVRPFRKRVALPRQRVQRLEVLGLPCGHASAVIKVTSLSGIPDADASAFSIDVIDEAKNASSGCIATGVAGRSL